VACALSLERADGRSIRSQEPQLEGCEPFGEQTWGGVPGRGPPGSNPRPSPPSPLRLQLSNPRLILHFSPAWRPGWIACSPIINFLDFFRLSMNKGSHLDALAPSCWTFPERVVTSRGQLTISRCSKPVSRGSMVGMPKPKLRRLQSRTQEHLPGSRPWLRRNHRKVCVTSAWVAPIEPVQALLGQDIRPRLKATAQDQNNSLSIALIVTPNGANRKTSSLSRSLKWPIHGVERHRPRKSAERLGLLADMEPRLSRHVLRSTRPHERHRGRLSNQRFHQNPSGGSLGTGSSPKGAPHSQKRAPRLKPVGVAL